MGAPFIFVRTVTRPGAAPARVVIPLPSTVKSSSRQTVDGEMTSSRTTIVLPVTTSRSTVTAVVDGGRFGSAGGISARRSEKS